MPFINTRFAFFCLTLWKIWGPVEIMTSRDRTESKPNQAAVCAASFKRQTVTRVLERTGVGTVLLRNCAMVSWSQVNMKWHPLLVSSPNAPSTSHSPEITTLVNTAINSLWTINFFKVSFKLAYKSSLINSLWK